MLMVVILCAALGWLRAEVERARQQQRAVEALGLSYWDLSPAPGWLGGPLIDDIFLSVDGAALDGPILSDSQWKHLETLTSIRVLYLRCAQVRDADLAHVRHLKELEALHLTSTEITDAGMFHLRGLTKLRELDAFGTAVTDVGVRDLHHSLPNCKIRIGTLKGDGSFDDIIELIQPDLVLRIAWEGDLPTTDGGKVSSP